MCLLHKNRRLTGVRDTDIVPSINKKATNLAENLNTANASKMGQKSSLYKNQLLSKGKNTYHCLVPLYFAT